MGQEANFSCQRCPRPVLDVLNEILHRNRYRDGMIGFFLRPIGRKERKMKDIKNTHVLGVRRAFRPGTALHEKLFEKTAISLFCGPMEGFQNVPAGVDVRDAGEIFPEDRVFTYKNGSYSAFFQPFPVCPHVKHRGALRRYGCSGPGWSPCARGGPVPRLPEEEGPTSLCRTGQTKMGFYPGGSVQSEHNIQSRTPAGRHHGSGLCRRGPLSGRPSGVGGLRPPAAHHAGQSLSQAGVRGQTAGICQWGRPLGIVRDFLFPAGGKFRAAPSFCTCIPKGGAGPGIDKNAVPGEGTLAHRLSSMYA